MPMHTHAHTAPIRTQWKHFFLVQFSMELPLSHTNLSLLSHCHTICLFVMAFHAKLITIVMCVCVFTVRALKLMETRKNCVWKYWAVSMRKDRMRTNQWISNYPIIQGKTFKCVVVLVMVCKNGCEMPNLRNWLNICNILRTRIPIHTLCVSRTWTLPNELNWNEMKLIWNETTKCLFNKQKLINIYNTDNADNNNRDKSSDEGDTSSDSTSTNSENELANFNGDEEGICCQPVPLVPPPSPVSTSKNRLNKRVTTTLHQIYIHAQLSACTHIRME